MNTTDIKFVEKKLGLNDQFFESWKGKYEIRKYKIGEIILNTNI